MWLFEVFKIINGLYQILFLYIDHWCDMPILKGVSAMCEFNTCTAGVSGLSDRGLESPARETGVSGLGKSPGKESGAEEKSLRPHYWPERHPWFWHPGVLGQSLRSLTKASGVYTLESPARVSGPWPKPPVYTHTSLRPGDPESPDKTRAAIAKHSDLHL
jgi:hypothetical protein